MFNHQYSPKKTPKGTEKQRRRESSTMDSELEHLQHLGLFGICKQGCKLIYSHKKIFTQITLAFILPLTLITLLEPLVCDALFGRLTTGEPNEFEIFSGRPREDSSNPLFWSYKVAHILFLAVFILLSTSTLVCSVACIYTAKPITFKKVISIIPKVWKRPFLSISCNIVFMVAYYVVAIVVFLSWMRRISDGEVKNNIPWVIGLVIWIILIIFVFVYNNLIWQLASVLSVLEPVYVVKAMMKSRVLIKGKLFAATFILLATIVPLGFAEKLFQGYVMHERSLAMLSKVVIAIVLFLFVHIWILYGIVLQTVIYFVCKALHHEMIDKSILSDHLEGDVQLKELGV